MASRSGASDPPTVSVVIPTRNRLANLRAVLAPLLADPALHEVVVVSDGCTDGTEEFLAGAAERDDRCRWVALGGVGAARARQVGVDACTGEIVLMVDDDVVAGDGLVSGHARHHRGGDRMGDPVDGTGLVVVGYMPTRRPRPRRPGFFATEIYAEEYEGHCAEWEADADLILPSLWNGNVSMPAETCRAVGVVSPALGVAYHEDQDFGIRLLGHGARAVFDRALVATHAHHRPLAAFRSDAYKQGVDRWNLARTYPEVLGEPSVAGITGRHPWAVQLLLRATDRPRTRSVVIGVARGALRMAGGLHAWPVETRLAKLVRRIELRHGARDAADGVVSGFSGAR